MFPLADISILLFRKRQKRRIIYPEQMRLFGMKIDRAALAEKVRYEPETGRFFWVAHYQGVTRGKLVGKVKQGRYHRIRLDGIGYRAHRLAWLYMTGEWPQGEIDHINGEPSDNRWENLREATHAQNMKNLGLNRLNTSGAKGVSFHKAAKKWRVTVSGKHIGLFTTIEATKAAYREASRVMHGEFTAVPHRVNSARGYQHFVVSEEARKADFLPGAMKVV